MSTFVVRLNPDTRDCTPYSHYPTTQECKAVVEAGAMDGFHEAVNFLPENGIVRGYLPPRHLNAMRTGEPFNLVTITAKTAQVGNDLVVGIQAGCRYEGENDRTGVPKRSSEVGLIWHYSCQESLSLLLPSPIPEAREAVLGARGEWVWGPTLQIGRGSVRRILNLIDDEDFSERDLEKFRRLSALMLDGAATPAVELVAESDFEASVAEALKRPLGRVSGNKFPLQKEVRSFQYQRDPKVVAHALLKAEGICHDCRKQGPFISRVTGLPYLEVHHVRMLKDGGSDTPDNVIAVCPNCHRKRHYGQ